MISRTVIKEFYAANEPDLSNTAFYLREPNWKEFNSNIVKSVFLYDVSETLTMTEKLNLDISKPENCEELWPGCLLAKNEE